MTTSRVPRRLAVAGLVAALPGVVLHLAGARACVSVLSGTYPTGVAPAVAEALGVLYVASFALATLAAPVLLLGAVFLSVILLVRRPPEGTTVTTGGDPCARPPFCSSDLC